MWWFLAVEIAFERSHHILKAPCIMILLWFLQSSGAQSQSFATTSLCYESFHLHKQVNAMLVNNRKGGGMMLVGLQSKQTSKSIPYSFSYMLWTKPKKNIHIWVLSLRWRFWRYGRIIFFITIKIFGQVVPSVRALSLFKRSPAFAWYCFLLECFHIMF